MNTNIPDDDTHELPEFFQTSGNASALDVSFTELEPDVPQNDALPIRTTTTTTSRDAQNFIWSMMVQKVLNDKTTKTSPAA